MARSPGFHALPPRILHMTILAIAVLAGATNASRADFIGHGGMVRDVTVSADGSLVATASFDYTARVWDFVVQRQRIQHDDHAAPVNAVALLAEGRTLVSAADDGIVRVWDEPEHLRLQLSGHTGKVAALAVSPDETTLATAGWDGTVRLWSLADGRERLRLETGSNVNAVTFSSDGDAVLGGDREGQIWIWNARTGEQVDRFQAHAMAVTALAANGSKVVSASIDGDARLWTPDQPSTPITFEGHDGPVLDAAFAPDGRVVTAGRDGQLGIWSPVAPHPVRWIDAHSGPVWSVAVTPDGRFAVTGGSDAAVRVWHLETGSPVGEPSEGTSERPAPWLSSDHPGARLYRACATCHALTAEEVQRSGPHFARLFGRRAGSVSGYAYSEPLRQATFVWDDNTLRELFEKGPDVLLPGTKMPLQRVPDPKDLANLVDYMRVLTEPAEARDHSGDQRKLP